MVRKTVTIKNPAGLYLNFAGVLCKEAMDYKSKINMIYGDTTINVKSILNVLGSNIRFNDSVEVICDGSDEQEALSAICRILEMENIEVG